MTASQDNADTPARRNSSGPPWGQVAHRVSGPLTQDLRVQVCIVGAGIAGLTTAYLLAREGRSVVVLDDGPVAGGESGRTTAHLSNALDDRYFEIERLHGDEGARRAARSHAAAISCIENFVRMESIDCDFERLDGFLFPASEKEMETLEREARAARAAGLTSVELVASPLPSWDSRCLRFPQQAQLHPIRYLSGLVRAIEALGGKIYAHTRVASVDGGSPAFVHGADGQSVEADSVVVATNVPFNDRVVMHTKQAAYRSYAIALRVAKNVIPRALYWDTADPYHYVRLARNDDATDLLIVGGEDHKTGQAEAGEQFARLEEWTRSRFPQAGEVLHRWSGQIIETLDGLAYIGRNPADADNVYIATGDSGHGMTHGTLAGMIISDLVAGRRNEWAELYDPSRKPVRAAAEFARENANVARQYTDWIRPGARQELNDIAPGDGAVIRKGIHHYAAYRDDNGLRVFSATCPHLGCIVHWNAAEKSFDCPCHGSRFDIQGRVMNGPASSSLQPAQLDESEEKQPWRHGSRQEGVRQGADRRAAEDRSAGRPPEKPRGEDRQLAEGRDAALRKDASAADAPVDARQAGAAHRHAAPAGAARRGAAPAVPARDAPRVEDPADVAQHGQGHLAGAPREGGEGRDAREGGHRRNER